MRSQAEETLVQKSLPARPLLDSDPQKLLHELQVHQIELEMQNNELRQAQAELEESRTLYRDLYDLAPIGYCTLDDEGRILQANLTAASLLGMSREALVEQPIRRFIAKDEQDKFNCYNQQLILEGGLRTCDLRMMKSGGSIFWARLRSVREVARGNKQVCRLTFGDISESKHLEEDLREQKSFFHLIAENLSDFIAVLDPEGRRLYNSPSYRQFFGDLNDLQGTNSFAEIHPDDRDRVRQVFMETVRSGLGRQINYRFVLADGSIRDMESRGSVIKDKEGEVARVVIVSRDITERNRLLERLHQMAFHDPLTQLPNRRLFSDRLSRALAASTRSDCYGALMFLDLDGFKPLNDAHGHDVGDVLLIQVAERLKACVREIDTVARFGGDEFVVMLGQLDMDEAKSISLAGSIAEKLRLALARRHILNIADPGGDDRVVNYRCTASVGVTLFGHQEVSQGAILKRADTAMYQAKNAGGNQVRFCPADGSPRGYLLKFEDDSDSTSPAE